MMRDEQLLKENMEIMQLIFKRQPLNKVLLKIIQSIKEHVHLQTIKDIVIHVRSGRNQLFKIASSSPEFFEKVFNKPIDVSHNNCIISQAAYDKQSVVYSPKSPRKSHSKVSLPDDDIEQAFNVGDYQTTWVVPMLSSSGQLVGTLTIFYDKKRHPSQTEGKIIEFYCHLIMTALSLLNDVENKQTRNERSLPLNDAVPNETLGILLELKNALYNKEFIIYYQPIYQCNHLKLLGLEALIRWNHPRTGLLPPAKFLEVAEATGFIIQIEHWVLEHAIAEIKKVRQGPLKDIRLSVNISAKQLERENFVDRLEEILIKHAYEPKHLTLEITERFLMQERNLRVMEKIKSIGVKLAIDDFGTSYSSLQYLKYLPIDEIKIDRSFTMDLDTNQNSQIIVEMIIKLAKQLQVTIVGEGVETKKQLEILKQFNCDQVQGFLFSKPRPLQEIVTSYRANRPINRK